MCGITGIAAFNDAGRQFFHKIEAANNCLNLRGPDNEGYYKNLSVVLGHRRLSIIDVSEAGNQPMTDTSGRYTIIFNGEFFNYREHREKLKNAGIQFDTSSDTEVLLKLYMTEGVSCLQKVNGFFAFAIYDQVENSIFIARDRMGIKPLLYFLDDDKLIFGSELKALMAAGIPRVADNISILNFLQLNYIPGPWSVFEKVRKLPPGHYLKFSLNESPKNIREVCYYSIPSGDNTSKPFEGSYESAKARLRELLNESVKKRLIADVPLGAFLSGGIDSSVIVALASQSTKGLNTFSIGYKDEPLYDETSYAKLVAEKYKTNHTVFSLSNDDLFEHLFSVLEYLDEPFADSSALAVNILSMHTRKHVTVALSGDGADEMFAGYNKHRAEWLIRNNKMLVGTAGLLSPLLKPLGGSRGSKISNKIRQLHRFANGAGMKPSERYWRWCGYAGEDEVSDLLMNPPDNSTYLTRKNNIMAPLSNGSTMNDILRMDMHLVLPNDMLVKVDMMSMANSLEVRVPFLDYTVVDFAFSIPDHFKIDKHSQKKILREAFKDELPPELFNRSKHGFEVPLLKWFRTGLRSMIEDELLEENFIVHQGIFNYEEILRLKTRLFSNNPGDIEARIWALIVFQYWWRKYMN